MTLIFRGVLVRREMMGTEKPERRRCIRGGPPLREHAVDQNITAIIPYCVELGVDREQLGRQVESILRVVVRSFLPTRPVITEP